MNLLLIRKWFGDDSTLGLLYKVPEMDSGEGAEFQCYILEDEVREVKVPGETAIPEGTYEILPRTEGKMHVKYEQRYGEAHVGMAHLQNVPGFKWIYIHSGNREDQTDGCPLTGTGYVTSTKGLANHEVTGSRSAYAPLYKLIAAAWAREEKVFIKVTNENIVLS